MGRTADRSRCKSRPRAGRKAAGGGPIRSLALTAAALVALSAPAMGNDDTIRHQEYEVYFVVMPGDWSELNMDMEEGGTIEWSVRTVHGEEVYIDLHSHQAPNNVEYHERFPASDRESGTFTAPQDDVYSILVANQVNDDNVTVRIKVTGTFAVASTVNIDPLPRGDGRETPGLGAVALAAPVLCWLWLHRRRPGSQRV